MPSLRRTSSSPSVRSSPYPYSSSLSSALARGRNHRRSSGSETSSRRVLADIDWWKVTDGQRNPNSGDVDDLPFDDTRRQVLENNLVPTLVVSLDVGVEHPSDLLSLPWGPEPAIDVCETLHTLPTEQFAALSISPSTPTRHGTGSPFSSLESSPEFAEAQLEDIPSELDVGLLDSSDWSPLPRFKRGPRRTLAPSLARSFTFADTFSLRADVPSHYADFAISPLSSAPNFLH